MVSKMHPDFIEAQKLVYEPLGFVIEHVEPEKESGEYGAAELQMNHRRMKFRVAKVTPKKIGQFVTLWKREGRGPIQPFDVQDPFDLFVISVRNCGRFGQFVFPKELLCKKKILSKDGKGGKRAIRVYPPWDIPNNQQAIETQKWQLPYFFQISPDTPLDAVSIQKLFLS